MVRKYLSLARHPVQRGAAILIATSALSYALGLLRDRTLAGTFGASDALDAYQAAFIVPDFIFNLFVAGALSATFLPVFTDLRTKKRQRQAAQLAGTLLFGGLSILIIVGLIAFLLAGPLTALVAPGFPPAKQALLANLTRVMLLSPLLFMVSNLLGSMLVSTKRFLFYGLSPALYNLGIIIGIAVLAPAVGIYAAVIGTILGAVLHLTVRLIDIRRARLSIIPTLQLTPAVKKVVKLMIPRMFGLTAIQVQLWAFVAIASTLGKGSVTIYNLARNFQSFPVSLIGISFATALFPLLAESASRRDRDQYFHHLTKGILVTASLVLPAALLIYVLRTSIVSFFVGTGEFDAVAVASTAAVLGIYTLSIPTESLVHILARSFYALHNTIIPVTVSLIAIATSITSAFILSQNLGIVGIPAGFALGTALQFVLLAVLLRRYAGRVLA